MALSSSSGMNITMISEKYSHSNMNGLNCSIALSHQHGLRWLTALSGNMGHGLQHRPWLQSDQRCRHGPSDSVTLRHQHGPGDSPVPRNPNGTSWQISFFLIWHGISFFYTHFVTSQLNHLWLLDSTEMRSQSDISLEPDGQVLP